MRRHKMGRSHSRSNFRHGADRIHKKNLMSSVGPMRGGIRL